VRGQGKAEFGVAEVSAGVDHATHSGRDRIVYRRVLEVEKLRSSP
jgi:hypothetical protein